MYRHRITELERVESALEHEHRLLGYLRLAFAAAIAVLLFPPRLAFLLPLAAFLLAARVHGGALDRLAAVRRALRLYEHAMARIEERWQGLVPRDPAVPHERSLYAADLDLFGAGSLFELLCEARTSLGEERLAQWLLAPAPPEELRERHAAVTDLRGRVALREAFARAPGPAQAQVDEKLLHPGEPEQARPLWPGWRLLAPLLVLAFLAAVWVWVTRHTPFWLVGVLALNGWVTFRLQHTFQALFPRAQKQSRTLLTATALLRALEEEAFEAPYLLLLQKRLRSSPVSASRAMEKLASLSPWIEGRSNYLVKLVDAPLLYSLQLALRVQQWRERHDALVHTWLDTLADFEALLSLAAYSFEHPQDCFPHLLASDNVFVAEALGHPLLPRQACIRNDVTLDRDTPVLLVSGSNMSGKSTLLRSVGINAVLAFAGAPVRAHSLQISPFQVACSIQVQDSLQAGRSRFYAEILRLQQITQHAASSPPVLFLIDEVLSGTNSSDRLEGVRGLLFDLLRKGALGLLSTHDLALIVLPEDGRFRGVRNVHFQDDLSGGELQFDYCLREGPVTRSNGIALMRLIGLDV